MSGCAVQNCINYSIGKLAQRGYIKSSINLSENDYERDFQSELAGIKRNRPLKTDAMPHLLLPNVTSNEFPERSERLKNRTMKRKLVSELTEMRKRHPENYKCE
ncbi:hypothetical protein PR048_029953 [Dryococelus australis]|uniref:Uncharacterized protein n=1 Tax=Dryococelus australis TaxID=614101 RepID=A0ABQ9GAD1_9NEOP|nr:hypothetical protein PR048_029953 [Dryococelus australis]